MYYPQPLPEQNQWHLYVGKQTSLLRQGKYQGLAIDTHNLEYALKLAHTAGTELNIQLTTENIDLVPTELQQKANEDTSQPAIEITLIEDELLIHLAKHFNPTKIINLQQDSYERKEQFFETLKPWKAVVITIVCWVMIQLSITVWKNHQLEKQIVWLDQHIEQSYRRAFPKTKRIINARVQMQQKLKQLQKGEKKISVDFIQLFVETGLIIDDMMAKGDGLTITRIRFLKNTLELDAQLNDLQKFEVLKQQLQQKTDFNVEILSASTRNGKVEGRMKIWKKP